MTIILLCFDIPLSSHAASSLSDDGSMNLDVVFVIDSSNSMLESDPDKIALDAFNLFIDLCDETCSVGYNTYTDKVISGKDIVSLGSGASVNGLKREINNIKYDLYGDTNHAEGLKSALNMHLEYGLDDKERKKAVIFLSDGKLHLSDSDAEKKAKKELDDTLKKLKENGIKVYAIGLNHEEENFDEEEIQTIASLTGGKSYEAKTSNELPSIIDNIFADIYDIVIPPPTPISNDIKIVIEESVFYVNIVIETSLSDKEINIRLKDNENHLVNLTNDSHVKKSSNKSYKLLKLIDPPSGVWHLLLDKVTEENCKITRMDFYSVYIKQETEPENITAGETMTIRASLIDKQKTVVDHDLLNSISMTSVIQNNGNEYKIALVRGSDGCYSGTFIPKQPGDYILQTTVDSSKLKKQSREQKFTVQELVQKLQLVQKLSSSSIKVGEDVTISVDLEEIEVFDELPVSCQVTDSSNSLKETFPLKKISDRKYEGVYSPPDKGKYMFVSSLEMDGKTKTSNQSQLVVNRQPMTLLKENMEIQLKSHPFNSSEKIPISDIVSFDENDKITVSVIPESTNSYDSSVSSENENMFIVFSGVNGGSDSAVVRIKNNFGETIDFPVDIDVEDTLTPLLTAIIIVAVIIAVIAVLILCICYKTFRNGKFILKLRVPSDCEASPPPSQQMCFPNKKHKISLHSAMKANRGCYQDYSDAIHELKLSPMLNDIIITAGKKGSFKVSLRSNKHISEFDGYDEKKRARPIMVGADNNSSCEIRNDNVTIIIECL